MAFMCRDCDVEFDSGAALDVHRRKFCPATKRAGGGGGSDSLSRTRQSAFDPDDLSVGGGDARTSRRDRVGASAPARESKAYRDRERERERAGGAATSYTSGRSASTLAHSGASIVGSRSAGFPRDADAARRRLNEQKDALSAQLADLRRSRGAPAYEERGRARERPPPQGGWTREREEDSYRDPRGAMMRDAGPPMQLQGEEDVRDVYGGGASRASPSPPPGGGGYPYEGSQYGSPPAPAGPQGYWPPPAGPPRAGYGAPYPVPPGAYGYGGGWGDPYAAAGPPHPGAYYGMQPPPPAAYHPGMMYPPYGAYPPDPSTAAAMWAAMTAAATHAATTAITATSSNTAVAATTTTAPATPLTSLQHPSSNAAGPPPFSARRDPPASTRPPPASQAAAATQMPMSPAATRTPASSPPASRPDSVAASLVAPPGGRSRRISLNTTASRPVLDRTDTSSVASGVIPPLSSTQPEAHVQGSSSPGMSSRAYLAVTPAVAGDASSGVTNEDSSIAMLLQLPRQVLETEYVQRQLKYLLEMREMRIETEKLTKQRDLEVLRAQVEREKEELAQKGAHETWLAQQKRLVREARIRKVLAKELGDDVAAQYLSGAGLSAELASGDVGMSALASPMSPSAVPSLAAPAPTLASKPSAGNVLAVASLSARGASTADALLGVNMDALPLATYQPAEGIHMLFDFANGLPSKAERIQVAYCFYVGGAAVGAVQAVSQIDTEPDPDSGAPATGGAFTRCMVAQQRIVDGDAGEDVTLVVELQRVTDADVRSIGWSAVPLFRQVPGRGSGDVRYSVFDRHIKLQLYKPPVNVDAGALNSTRALTPLKGSLFMRMFTHAQFVALVEAARSRAKATHETAAAVVSTTAVEDLPSAAAPVLALIGAPYARASMYRTPQQREAEASPPPSAVEALPPRSLSWDGVVGLDVLSCSADTAGVVPVASAPAMQLRITALVDTNVACAPAVVKQGDSGAVLTGERPGGATYKPLSFGVGVAAPPQLGDVQRAPAYQWASSASDTISRSDAGSSNQPSLASFELLPLQTAPYRPAAPADIIASHPSSITVVVEAFTVPSSSAAAGPRRLLWSRVTMMDILEALRALLTATAGPSASFDALMAASTRPSVEGAASLPCTVPIGLILPLYATTAAVPTAFIQEPVEAALPDPATFTILVRLRCNPATLTNLMTAAQRAPLGRAPSSGNLTGMPAAPTAAAPGALRRGLSAASEPGSAAAAVYDARLSASKPLGPPMPNDDGTSSQVSTATDNAAMVPSTASSPLRRGASGRQDVVAAQPPEPPPPEELAWCDVTAPPPPQVVFDSARDMFDVYVDAARFLSDNVTISKVVVKLLTSAFKPVGTPFEALSDMNVSLLNPRFAAVARFLPAGASVSQAAASAAAAAGITLVKLTPEMDASTTLIIRIDTLESHTHALQVAGYAVLNLFAILGGSSSDQPGLPHKAAATASSTRVMRTIPSMSSMTSFVLNEGAFQLPLFQAPPAKTSPLNTDCLNNTPRVPCATALVRLRRVPASAGLGAPAATTLPTYASQAYDSTRCRPLPAEILLYPKRADVPAPTLNEFLDYYSESGVALGLTPTPAAISPVPAHVPPDIASLGIPPSRNTPGSSVDASRREWALRRLAGTPVSMLDFLYLAPYDATMGFKLRVDAVHNIPPRVQAIVKVMHTVLPPAAYYSSPRDTSGCHLTQLHDWTSSMKTQLYRDTYNVHVGAAYEPGMMVVFDVKAVTVRRNGEHSVDSLGWGIMPIFDARGEGYVNRGAFVVPLMEGAPSRALLDEFREGRESFQDTFRRVTNVAASDGKGVGAFLSRRFGSSRAVTGTGSARAMATLMKENTCLLVRLHDGQFTGIMGVHASGYSTVHIPHEVVERYEMGAVSLDALPNDDTPPLTKLRPKGVEEEAFDSSVNNTIAQYMGITLRPRIAATSVVSRRGILPQASTHADAPPAPVVAAAARGASTRNLGAAAVPSGGGAGMSNRALVPRSTAAPPVHVDVA